MKTILFKSFNFYIIHHVKKKSFKNKEKILFTTERAAELFCSVHVFFILAEIKQINVPAV